MTTKQKALIIGSCILLFLLYLSGYYQKIVDILLVIAYTALFLFVLSPICGWFEKAGMSACTAAAVSVMIVFAGILFFVAVLLPYLVAHTARIASSCLPALYNVMNDAENTFIFSACAALESTGAMDSIISFAGRFAGMFVRGGLSAAAETGRMLFSLVIAFYALKERALLAYHLQLFIPSVMREPVLTSVKAIRNAVMGYFSGLIKTSLFVGMATTVVLFLLGIRDALLLGALMGFLEVIPYIGPVLGTVPILLSAAPLGGNRVFIVIILVFLIQQAESSFIGPYFTAASPSVHPLTALLSVYVCGSLFGLWGILLAIPCTAALQSAAWSIAHIRNAVKA